MYSVISFYQASVLKFFFCFKEQSAESPSGELNYKTPGGLPDDDLFRERLRNMGKSKY